MSHILGYARVSTLQQDEALQLDALTAAGAARIYTDRVSTRAERRPELDRLLERADAGDTIVVWRLDRLARSLTELIALVDEFGRRQVHLRSLGEQIDTGTAGGRLLFHLMASIAEFERDLIRERTMAGLHAARARGRTGGRPSALTEEKRALARELYESKKYEVSQIARTLGVSRSTVYRSLIPDGAAS